MGEKKLREVIPLSATSFLYSFYYHYVWGKIGMMRQLETWASPQFELFPLVLTDRDAGSIGEHTAKLSAARHTVACSHESSWLAAGSQAHSWRMNHVSPFRAGSGFSALHPPQKWFQLPHSWFLCLKPVWPLTNAYGCYPTKHSHQPGATLLPPPGSLDPFYCDLVSLGLVLDKSSLHTLFGGIGIYWPDMLALSWNPGGFLLT